MGPENPSCLARSGVTTPMFTVRCFQMRLSVSRVSYSSMQAGKRLTKSAMKSSKPPERRLYSQQLLDRHDIGVLVAHHRHVIQPIHVADRLIEGFALGELLRPTVQ